MNADTTHARSHVVAFDTATERCAIGVGVRDDKTVVRVGSRDFEAPRSAMSGLAPAVSELLEQLHVPLWEVGSVVVGRGPGSFTGVRIGVASAKGLAHGLRVPLFGVGTLDAIAWGMPEGWCGTLGVVGDAMRGEVYPALFDVTFESGRRKAARRAADHVSKPDAVAAEWARLDEDLMLAGNGLVKYGELFTEALYGRHELARPESWAPTGDGLLRAFEASLESGTAVGGDPGVVLPVYTRLSDAEEAEHARAGLGQASVPHTGVGGPPGGNQNGDAGVSP